MTEHRYIPAVLLLLLLLSPLLPPTRPAAAGTWSQLDKQYRLAKAYAHNLATDHTAARDRWLRGMAAFQALAAAPGFHLAPASLFHSARLAVASYQRFGQPADLLHGEQALQQLVKRYQHHPLTDDAYYQLGLLALDARQQPRRASRIFAKIIALFPDGDMVAAASRSLKAVRGQLGRADPGQPLSDKRATRVVDLRYGSTSYYSRIVIECSNQVTYREHRLPAVAGKPQRLYLDLSPARLPRDLAEPIPIHDGLLLRLRSAQHSPDTVRVVLDTQTLSDYRIATLADPFRVVIDVWGQGGQAPAVAGQGPLSLPRQLGLSARRIILDAGHGGNDPGAIGINGLREKDLTLAICKRLAIRLQEHGFEPLLTRSSDTYVPLEERTAFANHRQGDLFVSIHINASPRRAARGVETYFLSLAASQEEMRAASRENAASTSKLSDLEAILLDLMQNSKVEESARLASSVQEALVRGLTAHYQGVTDLGIKKAPFIVLIGAQMPAILAEVGFLSNPVEAGRLRDPHYLDSIAIQLSRGIIAYTDSLQGTRHLTATQP